MNVIRAAESSVWHEISKRVLWWIREKFTCETCKSEFSLAPEDKDKIHFLIDEVQDCGLVHWGYYIDCPVCGDDVPIFRSFSSDRRMSLFEIGRRKYEEQKRLKQQERNKAELGKSITCERKEHPTVPLVRVQETYTCSRCGVYGNSLERLPHKADCPNEIN